MQQIYLGWDIMDEYHNIIDHYQGYYYLHSLFQNTAQVKTFQSENSSCFEFSNPAKKGRLENPSGKKSQNGIFAKLGYLGVVTRCSATSLRYGLEIQRTKCGKHLPSSEEKKKCGRVWGILKDIEKYKKILEDIEVVGQGLCWVGGEAKVNFGPGCQTGNLEKTTLKVTR